MPHEEAQNYGKGRRTAAYYEQTLREARAQEKKDARLEKVIKAEQMPWENSRQGKIKHMVNGKMNARVRTIDAYIQELPPGGRSGKHRHMWEEYIFILEGKGYDMHWDMEAEFGDAYRWRVKDGVRYDWQAGDIVYIPVNTVHQHVNADLDKRARLISAQNRVYKFLGFNDLEQLEDAPRVRQGSPGKTRGTRKRRSR